MKKLYTATILLLFCFTYTFGQYGELLGKVTDAGTGKGIGFAVVAVLQNGTIKITGLTDNDGNYSIKPLNPGIYDIRTLYTGYKKDTIRGVQITPDNATYQNIQLSNTNTLGPVIVKEKLIKPGDFGDSKTFSHAQLSKIPVDINNVNNVVATSAKVFQADAGGAIFVGGSRSYSNKYYVDGIPMTGTIGLPTSAIEQINLVTGGIDAKYGDATGGIINITTRGPSSQYHGGAEIVTSELVDAEGYNRVNLSLSGPLLSKYKHTDSADAKIGFFISGEYEGSKSGLSANGYYKVKDSLLNAIRANPLQPAAIGSGFVEKASFITAGDIVKINAAQNSAGGAERIVANLDFKLNKYTDLSVRGNAELGQGYGFNETAALLDPDHNGYSTSGTYRGTIKFTQRFAPAKSEGKNDKTATFQNAYYSIQADYTKFHSESYDKNLGKNNIMDYGYYGKFHDYSAPQYKIVDSIYDPSGSGKKIFKRAFAYTGTTDTLITYKPGGVNPGLEAYVDDYYTLTGSTPINGVYGINGDHSYYNSFSTLLGRGGFYDGFFPNTIYSLWLPTGYPQAGIGKTDNNTYHFAFQGSVDIVSASKSSKGDQDRHSIVFGFEYQQADNSSWSVSPYGLWSLANQLANRNKALDTLHPIVSQFPDGNGFYNVNYNYLPVQGYFASNLRKKLGVASNQIINVYDLDPSVITLDMFSPDDLLNNGGAYVSYNGYDVYGNKLSKQPSFFDFFNQQETVNGQTIYTRPIGAFRPIYAAAYVEDNFKFKDLVFNIGLRVDRYDANQKVPKDLYSLWPIRTADEVRGQNELSVPSNVPGNYAVYVNSASNPTSILGYRSGDNWYDATGAAVSDPKLIAQSTSSGIITPYLESPYTSNSAITPAGFTDYVPQLSFMPRIAFNFPISDEAIFSAYYDVLTQRPNNNQASPYNYYFFRDIAVGGGILNNPNLVPEEKIDYEVKFQQSLGKTSALTLSAEYEELKNQVEVRKVLYAVPIDYTTFGNIDFGTVKSFSATYEMRRTHNIRLELNYTLQFAEGTGSNQGTQLNLINSGAPNLRQILPFDYDQRHTINATVDYRFGEGEDYDGPIWKNKKILQNTGLSALFKIGSGTPYSQQLTPTPDEEFGVVTQTSLKGNINGSRLPYSFRIDARLDRDIVITTRNDRNQKARKSLYVNVYVQAENLLNTKNILSVHRFTGSPTDDGFLSSATGQQSLSDKLSAQSFIDLYNTRLLDPGVYARPRIIRVGASLNF